jgi:O-antigen/teichoic acid export membrane protein
MSIGMLLFNSVLQFVNFIMIARAIGPAGYGVIVAVAAIVTISVELVGLGCGDMLTKTIARGQDLVRLAFGNALVLVLLTLLPVFAGSTAFLVFFMPVDGAFLLVALALLFAELVSARALALSEHLAIANKQPLTANIYRIGFSSVRLAMILVAMLLFRVSDLSQWWLWQFCFGTIVAPLSLVLAARRFGMPILNLRTFNLGTGMMFSLNQIVRALQLNIDRLVMGPVLSTASLGIYGTGARLVQFSLIPVQAILRTTYPQFHECGHRSFGAARAYAYKVMPGILVVAFIPAAAVWILAPIFAALMGEGFEPVTNVLRGLAPLPIALAIQYVYGDVLSGADHQNWRTGLSIITTALLSLGIYVSSQSWGIEGGIMAVVVGNVLIALCYFAVVETLHRRAATRKP